jgi:hypothetical protein
VLFIGLFEKADSPQRRRGHRGFAEKREVEKKKKRRKRKKSFVLLSARPLCPLRLCGEFRSAFNIFAHTSIRPLVLDGITCLWGD